jgi:1-deoxy-D-xylulose-5-phosphate reductoisomerase
MSAGCKSLAILGSTGSIGRSALELLDLHPEAFRVSALTAARRVEDLAEQVRRYRPAVAAIADPELEPTYRALQHGIPVALANKEALVMGGPLMVGEARRQGAALLPVDSEHNALHQCLRGEKVTEVRRLILTASGGPFRTVPVEALHGVTPGDALNHPTWEMGPKITIDSATLMNKGLEVIEAHWLFGLPGEQIDVIIHPQSIVHSMVEFIDGSVMAQMGVNDMKHPIQYALSYPERDTTGMPPLDLIARAPLEFEEVDRGKFPCLGLAYSALRQSGLAPVFLNAANEVAVAGFLEGRLPFPGIPEVVDEVLQGHEGGTASSLDEVLEADRRARAQARRSVERREGT